MAKARRKVGKRRATSRKAHPAKAREPEGFFAAFLKIFEPSPEARKKPRKK